VCAPCSCSAVMSKCGSAETGMNSTSTSTLRVGRTGAGAASRAAAPCSCEARASNHCATGVASQRVGRRPDHQPRCPPPGLDESQPEEAKLSARGQRLTWSRVR
jgi:hypothetical protein